MTTKENLFPSVAKQTMFKMIATFDEKNLGIRYTKVDAM